MIQQKDLILVSPSVALSNYTRQNTLNIQLGGSKSFITADVIKSYKT